MIFGLCDCMSKNVMQVKGGVVSYGSYWEVEGPWLISMMRVRPTTFSQKPGFRE